MADGLGDIWKSELQQSCQLQKEEGITCLQDVGGEATPTCAIRDMGAYQR